MGEIDSAAFSVSVDNQAEIRGWLEEFSRLRDAVERQFEDLVRLAQNRPLIRLTIRYEGTHNDGQDRAGEASTDTAPGRGPGGLSTRSTPALNDGSPLGGSDG